MKARSLHDLAAIKAALQHAQREAEAQAARAKEVALREKRERELFATSVGAVQSLPGRQARSYRAATA